MKFGRAGLGSEATWVVAGQVASLGGYVACVKLLAHVLDKTAYGQLAVGTAVSQALLIVALGPLAQGLLRYFFAAREAGQQAAFLGAARTLAARATGLTLALALSVLIALAASSYARWVPIVALGVVWTIVVGWTLLVDAMQNAARRRSVVALHQGAGQWLRCLVALGLVMLVRRSGAMAMCGYIAAALLLLGSQLAFLRQTLRAGEHAALTLPEGDHPVAGGGPGWAERLTSYSWPFAVFGLPVGVHMVSDVWALERFSAGDGSVQIAGYAILLQIGSKPVMQLNDALIQVALPIVFGRAGDGRDQGRLVGADGVTARLVAISLALTVVGTLTAVALRVPIFRLIAPSYLNVADLLPVMVLAAGIFHSGQIVTLAPMSRGDARALIVPKVATAVLGTLLNILGARHFGVPGVAFAGLASSSAFALGVTFLWTRSRRRERLLAP